MSVKERLRELFSSEYITHQRRAALRALRIAREYDADLLEDAAQGDGDEQLSQTARKHRREAEALKKLEEEDTLRRLYRDFG